MKKSQLTQEKFEKLLHDWYLHNCRDLPWRNTRDPYAIWVSEIMLQQTQVARVKIYFEKFLQRFPKVQVLASAQWKEVLEYWRGLGYYRRARNLHTTAQLVVQNFQGQFPAHYVELLQLPGIGSYTAAALASFAFGETVPALDTNIKRVFKRIFAEQWTELSPGKQFAFAQKFIGSLGSRDFNYALMDLGSLICQARKPKCEDCCFQKSCLFQVRDQETVQFLKQKMLMLPLKHVPSIALADRPLKRLQWKQKQDTPEIVVAAGVLIHEGKVLICKRPKGKILAGFWEFPGGKLESGEDGRRCLKREFMEELGVEVAVRPAFFHADTEYDGIRIALSFYRCSLLLGEVQSLENQEFRWVQPHELLNYRFPDRRISD